MNGEFYMSTWINYSIHSFVSSDRERWVCRFLVNKATVDFSF